MPRILLADENFFGSPIFDLMMMMDLLCLCVENV